MATQFRSRAATAHSRSDDTQRAHVISLPAWLGLVVALLVLAVGFIWLLAGQVPVTVHGSGVVVASPVNTQVLSPVEGTILQSPTGVGEGVATGDVIVRIQPSSGAPPVEIRAQAPGTVVGLGSGEGAVVAAGDYLLTLAPAEAPLQGFVYVAANSSVAISPGDEVRLLPTAADPQANGFLAGVVTDVGVIPATADRVAYTTGNPQAAADILAQGLVIEVQVALIADSTAPSGYVWTMPPGPAQPTVSGSLATAQIIVDQVRPYRAFFPGV